MTQSAPTLSAEDLKAVDPKGLIRESYAIEGITLAECQSILIDWALSLPLGQNSAQAADALLAHYGSHAQGHPMTHLLTQARAPQDSAAGAPARRGGRAKRLGY
jgi:hypothetical protein